MPAAWLTRIAIAIPMPMPIASLAAFASFAMVMRRTDGAEWAQVA